MTSTSTWRIFYFVDKDAIVILDVTDKKSRATDQDNRELQAPASALQGQRLKPPRSPERVEMNAARKKRLEAAGWKVGTRGEFLGLTPEEAELVEVRLILSDSLRRHRVKRRLTQDALAKKLGSSQSRVAKLEAGARGVTLDLLFRALYATGATTEEIARELREGRRSAA